MTQIEDIIFRRLEDHEMRMRKLEIAYWRQMGMVIAATGIGSVIAHLAIRLLT
jgi:hypothetical protein